MNPSDIDVRMTYSYEDSDSEPLAGRFSFAYTVRITNNSDQPIRVLRRYWRVTEGDGEVHQIHAEGVIGDTQPLIEPRKEFSYSSKAVLRTSVGYMEGHYIVHTESDDEVTVDIPLFRMERPHSIQ